LQEGRHMEAYAGGASRGSKAGGPHIDATQPHVHHDSTETMGETEWSEGG